MIRNELPLPNTYTLFVCVGLIYLIAKHCRCVVLFRHVCARSLCSYLPPAGADIVAILPIQFKDYNHV